MIAAQPMQRQAGRFFVSTDITTAMHGLTLENASSMIAA
jgi:hypothetical protein